MGCYCSSPHQAKEKFNDEPYLFGRFREGAVWVPDNIDGLKATYVSPELPIYSAQIDQGMAFHAMTILNYLMPCYWPYDLMKCAKSPIDCLLFCDGRCDLTAIRQWVRKEYSTRTVYYIYENRVVTTHPKLRFPWACCGCGSWNIDHYTVNVFDRGAFGFRTVKCGTVEHLCWIWRPFGGVVGRQRCPCNGSLWPRMFSDCGGCWCEEWVCNYLGCLYLYYGLADPDETAFASNIALQAYFEGRKLTKEDMDRCVEYYKENIVPKPAPPPDPRTLSWLYRFFLAVLDFIKSLIKGELIYLCTHPKRNVPYTHPVPETKRVYDLYEKHRAAEINQFREVVMEDYLPPQCTGCDRCFGRRGVCFCTEDISKCCSHKRGELAPPYETPFAYDRGEYSAADVLRRVVGPPPVRVVIRTEPNATADLESGSLQVDMSECDTSGPSVSMQPVYVPKPEQSDMRSSFNINDNVDSPV